MRGSSRLLVLDRHSGAVADRQFEDLPRLLHAGDVLVVNDTRVFAARLTGRRLPGGGVAECLLIRRLTSTGTVEIWEALVHPGQRLKEGSRLELGSGPHRVHAEVLSRRFHGRRTVRLHTDTGTVADAVDAIGHVPLPPYIRRPDAIADRDRYQTVYATTRGSIAAPTAGLHFTPAVLSRLESMGVQRVAVTLHVGYGTFQPIRCERIEDHRMEEEHYDVSPETARTINRALDDGRRVVAVGTTTTRTLESIVDPDGRVHAGSGSTSLFITPGHVFRVVSALITNFHLPHSSLLVLVSALAGRDRVLSAYRHGVAQGYRFYSYGDAMLVV